MRLEVRGDASPDGRRKRACGRLPRPSSIRYPLFRYPLFRYPLFRYPLFRYPLFRYPLFILCAALVFGGGCAYYSFTGATIPAHLRTITIPLADDVSANPLPAMGDRFTQLLQDRFVGQTRLSLETTEGQSDAVLTSQIQRYVNEPASVGGQQVARLNRITITVLVTYYDRVEERQVFERAFSGSNEYDPMDLAAEEEAAAVILANIADDVFTAATSNW